MNNRSRFLFTVVVYIVVSFRFLFVFDAEYTTLREEMDALCFIHALLNDLLLLFHIKNARPSQVVRSLIIRG